MCFGVRVAPTYLQGSPGLKSRPSGEMFPWLGLPTGAWMDGPKLSTVQQSVPLSLEGGASEGLLQHPCPVPGANYSCRAGRLWKGIAWGLTAAFGALATGAGYRSPFPSQQGHLAGSGPFYGQLGGDAGARQVGQPSQGLVPTILLEADENVCISFLMKIKKELKLKKMC